MEKHDFVAESMPFGFWGEEIEPQLHTVVSVSDLKRLLGKTEDHNALDSNGDTPLHCHVKRKDEEGFNCLMTMLIHSKCDVNLAREKDGQTALHLACQNNYMEAVKALIAFDARINPDNKGKETPLDIALKYQINDGDKPANDEIRYMLRALGGMTYKEILDRKPPSVEEMHFEKLSYQMRGRMDFATTMAKESPVSVAASMEETTHIGASLLEQQQPPGLPSTAQDESSSEVQEKDEMKQSKLNPKVMVMKTKLGKSVIPENKQTLSSSSSARELRLQIQRSQEGKAGMLQELQETQQEEIKTGYRISSSLEPSTPSKKPGSAEEKKQEGQRVLVLDGGGMKGLIEIELLKSIEQMMGKSISELFDWVVGTSTGGILALGMIYGGLSLGKLRRVYFEMKDTVFKQQSKFISHTCDTNALEDLLKRMLGTEMRMDDIKKPNVLITAVDKRTTKLPLVFFNNCFDEDTKKSIRNELVWKVARYTSAAPVFFAECDNYVDGGVVANNPTTFALPEIQEFLTKKHGYKSPASKVSCVVSLGCGIYPPEPLGNTDIADALKITKLYSAPRRLGDLLTLLTTALGGSEDMARLCRINCEQQGISYFRFSPEIGEDVGTTEKDSRKLCEIIIRAKQLFVENSEQVEEMIRILGCSVQDESLYHV